MKEKFVEPMIEFVPLGEVHMAKSWNPGKGKDTTGTGNSGNNGNAGGNGKGNGKGNR